VEYPLLIHLGRPVDGSDEEHGRTPKLFVTASKGSHIRLLFSSRYSLLVVAYSL
jgi:hypothetical protein